MKSPFHHIKHAHKTFEHFHQNLHHAFVLIIGAIIGMLRGASHILTPTTATWQRGGFITSDFWEQNPSNGNIQYALFGDGTPGSTAYTRTWTTSCVPTSISFLSSGSGGPLPGNTIYVINSGTYILTNNLILNGDCIALVGKGKVIINGNGYSLYANGRNNIIIDNISFNGQNTTATGFYFYNTTNITLNNINAYQNSFVGMFMIDCTANISNSLFYNNVIGVAGSLYLSPDTNLYVNNSHFYNNHLGLFVGGNPFTITINNSQFYNNSGYSILGENVGGAHLIFTSGSVINNSLFYNNKGIGLEVSDNSTTIINNSKFYNNQTGLILQGTGIGYGTISFFGNSWDMNIIGGTFTTQTSSPIASRSNGVITTGTDTLSLDWMTNPQNNSGQWLLNGTNRLSLRGIQPFDPTEIPIRYIFGSNIIKQKRPVRYNGTSLQEYGTNEADYFTTRYIAEPESTLPLNQQNLVNQYFGSGSIYTQNRQTNGCSLSAFQVITLDPGMFSSTYNFQDHTIYILTGGEYRSTTTSTNGFVFSGNCIALIGNKDTRFTKSSSTMMNLLYAKDRYNLIIDNIKIDGLYYDNNLYSPPVKSAINFDGITNNTTINATQIANTSRYGIFLGLGSHHNTILNTQSFNNGIAGMYLYYASNYNIINNTQTYNNGSYGIRFANGSARNTINNFQSYNNTIGIYGDLTTQENIINRAAIYNNSEAGIFFKNSSGNSLNDVRIYNNTIGIKTLYSSLGNKYYGELALYNNPSGNFDGTNANDSSLSPGSAGLFPYAGSIFTGTVLAGCTYATNPTLSGTTTNLLNTNCSNTGYTTAFISPNTAYVNYMFGLNMYKQKVPVRYSSGSSSLTQLSSQYDPSKYIAEILPIRDDEPENVIFFISGIIQPNTRYTTNIYTAGVVNIPIPVSLSFSASSASGNLIISGNSTGLTGTVSNGDTIQIRILSASGFNQTITGTVIIGSVTTVFTITTRDISQTPTSGSFAFTNFTSMPTNTFTGSTVTISGIETGVYASIAFEPTTTSGRLEIYSGNTMTASGTTGLLVYNGNQVKAMGQSSSGLSQTVTGYVTIGLGTGIFTITTKGSDTVPPTTPLLTYPLSGESLFFITRERTAASDTGSGIEGYVYEIAEDSNFINIVNTGFIATSTGTMGWPNTGFDATSDTFYRRLQARDRDGNLSSRSNIGRFKAMDSDERIFNDRNKANLRTYYDSNEITLEGMKAGITLRASVDDNGTLYKNGNDKGTGTYVQNGDKLYVTVRSSNRYGKTVSTTLTITNRELSFNVITKEENENGCTLSDEDQETIQNIFDTLIQNYSGDQNRYEEFLITMQSMLEDEIDFTNDCNLQYLKDLIANTLGIGTGTIITTGTHIAPNCKEYIISYIPSTTSYTSPTLIRTTYFVNRDTLTRYIDSKNPGDCHINTYGVSSRIFTNTDPTKHIASNGKMYFITMEDGKYTSNDFIYKKYFSSIAELRAYIDKNNPPPEVWNHQVDTSFTPQNFIAPNGKEYKIYKTNRGYMSYKLLKVQYFSTLSELQSYITKNNPR